MAHGPQGIEDVCVEQWIDGFQHGALFDVRNHDAGVSRELIRAIAGRELDTIDQVLKCYAAVTADQAAVALNIRLAYEAEGRRP
jgi:hypothetical protein